MRLLGGTSDLYIGKSTLLKIFLLGGVAIISAIFIWYTFSVIEKLQRDTRDQVEKYVLLWQLAANSPSSDSDTELQFIFNEIIQKANFPIIVLDEKHEPLYWRNLSDVAENDTTAVSRARLRKEAKEMSDANGEFPLIFAETHANYLLYGDTEAIKQLRRMPFVQIGIVLAFMIVGMIGFQNIRRSEERHIWVGMAKEAAHQLGTPISSLMGWLEVLGSEHSSDIASAKPNELVDETVSNMKVDVDRLQRVANRFGLIGSVPDLQPSNLAGLVDEVAEYYRRRLPFQGDGIRIDVTHAALSPVPLNPELLTWAFENLLKNAIQAVDSKTGRIEIMSGLRTETNSVLIEVKDNGKGITAAAARKIFRPGFTTKKRGWGLGLTLVKRIVEDYHGGSVYLNKSKPGETVFHIVLPTVAKNKG
ncbi:MAG: HAMP domain-containing histidine kinase [candidate division Zixibacteria bacterium]|nr:HAMP domain-containing histidine kinase [candidate division Zixibacteria bacterium]